MELLLLLLLLWPAAELSDCERRHRAALTASIIHGLDCSVPHSAGADVRRCVTTSPNDPPSASGVWVEYED